jgi:hypothetical protein
LKNAEAILQGVRAAAQQAPDHAAYIRQIEASSDTAPLLARGGQTP